MPKQYPLDLVLLGTLHPAIAQMVGLYWVDQDVGPNMSYDYLIVAAHRESLGNSWMAAKQWLIINLSKGKLRDHAHTLGNLVFAKLQFDVMARANLSEQNRPIFTIFCDEVQNLAENDLVMPPAPANPKV